jgi:hypothetical protein
VKRRTFAVGAVTVLVLGFAVALGARGDTNEQTEQEKIDEALAGIEEELEKVGPIVGPGRDPRRRTVGSTFEAARPLLEIGSGDHWRTSRHRRAPTPADEVDRLRIASR